MKIVDKIKRFFSELWESLNQLIEEGQESLEKYIEITKNRLGDAISDEWEDIKELIAKKARNELEIVLNKLDKLELINKTQELNYAELFVYNKDSRKHFRNLVAIKRLLI